MDGVFIFVNIDPLFNIPLEVLTELRNQERLEVTNVQRAWLEQPVQSNDDDNANNFTFGGENAMDHGCSASAFGRTASAVFRMVMLHAVQIPRGLWPEFGETSESRNKRSLKFEVLLARPPSNESFKLLTNPNKETARMYWSTYDHIFPHFHIESEVLRNVDGRGRRADFRNMMLIFRNNFSEVLEITTNADATMNRQDGTYDSHINVLCIRRAINSNEEDIEGGKFETMKKYCMPIEVRENYNDDVLSVFSGGEDEDLQTRLNELVLGTLSEADLQ